MTAAAIPDGFRAITLETVDSTNRHALDMAAEPSADRTWVVAREQTGGRGRHGRLWSSPPGNLYATLLLIDPCPPAEAPKLGFVAGIAACEAARRHAPGADIRVKWPNDLIVLPEAAKLCGILLEGRQLADGRQAVAIGIGINVAGAPDVPGRIATSLAALGSAADANAVFASLAAAFAGALAAFRRAAGFAGVARIWSELALPEGTVMGVKLPGRELSGTFAGIDGAGRLALDTGGALVHVEAGDVFLPGATGGAKGKQDTKEL